MGTAHQSDEMLSTTMRTHFAVLCFSISANLCWQLSTDLTWWETRELCVMCLSDPPFLREAKSIHLCPFAVPVSHRICMRRRLWALAKSRGDRDSQGSSSKVSADTQQSQSSPCITPEQHGGCTLPSPPQWHWLERHVACNPDLFTVSC